METKKSDKANLENKRGLFFALGIVLATAIFFVGLEYSTYDTDSFVEEQFFDDLAQDFELVSTMDEDEELTPSSPQEKTTVFTENIKETDEMPSEIDETSAPVPSMENELVEDANEKLEETPTPPMAMNESENPLNFRIVEEMPEFPGGMVEYMKWLTRNLRYPDIAKNNRIQGKVVVQFIVNKDGTIADAKVVKSVNPYLDKEAMRVIRMMPNWKPGIQDNKPCKTMVAVPIVFKL